MKAIVKTLIIAAVIIIAAFLLLPTPVVAYFIIGVFVLYSIFEIIEYRLSLKHFMTMDIKIEKFNELRMDRMFYFCDERIIWVDGLVNNAVELEKKLPMMGCIKDKLKDQNFYYLGDDYDKHALKIVSKYNFTVVVDRIFDR